MNAPAHLPAEDIGTPVSVKIRERIQAARHRFHANDNIAAFVLPGELDARLRHGFELCLGRPPLPAELQALRSHHDDQLRLAGGDPRLALVATARLIMNLDEFITRE